MAGMDIQYPLAGVIVLAGAVFFLKCLDFLKAKSAGETKLNKGIAF